MKSGLLAGLYAMKALVSAGPLPFERVTFVANPDEEIGSPSSTPHIREIAAESDACLVLECARANGAIVSSRKGILDARVTVRGRAAHAGVEPEKGRSAILAAADLVTRLHGLNGRWDGVTINVGVIAGGTRPNVVGRALLVRGGHARRPSSGLRGRRGRDPVDARRRSSFPTSPPTSSRWRAGGRWRSSSAPAGSSSTPGDRPAGWASRCRTRRPAARPMRTRPPGWGSPSIDGLGPIGGMDHSPSRIPRGRLDRSADRHARGTAPRHRARPGRPRLAGGGTRRDS